MTLSAMERLQHSPVYKRADEKVRGVLRTLLADSVRGELDDLKSDLVTLETMVSERERAVKDANPADLRTLRALEAQADTARTLLKGQRNTIASLQEQLDELEGGGG